MNLTLFSTFLAHFYSRLVAAGFSLRAGAHKHFNQRRLKPAATALTAIVRIKIENGANPFLFFVLGTILFLAGCSTMNSKFDCQQKPGVMCRSLDQVNAMVDRGELGKDMSLSKNPDKKFYSLPEVVPSHAPVRADETMMRIWIAPYQDTQGNYHASENLYTIVKPSHWIAPVEVTE